jgi:hypothetical protein
MASGVIISDRGEVPERSNGAVLKTAEPKGSVGSNPTLSARGSRTICSLRHWTPLRPVTIGHRTSAATAG